MHVSSAFHHQNNNHNSIYHTVEPTLGGNDVTVPSDCKYLKVLIDNGLDLVKVSSWQCFSHDATLY
jgi:hypothetical protein